MRICKLITLAALTSWTALAPACAQTVFWERKARGDTFSCPVSGNYGWPNNNNWSQDEHWGLACTPPISVRTQPSNWSTTTYPNGPSYDVILGSSNGAPTHLDLPVTLHSLTILPDGGLDMEMNTTITASAFDFQADGTIPVNGGYYLAPWPVLNIADGGTLTKSGGSGTLTIGPNVSINGSGAAISVNSGTLTLQSGANYSWTNFTLHLPTSTACNLVANNVLWRGTISGSGAGTFLVNCGNLYSYGATLDFPGPMFQWTGGTFIHAATNLGTMNVAGPASKTLESSCTLYNPGTFAVTDSGALVYGGGVLANLPSGTVDLQSDAAMSVAYMSAGSITNWGLFRKSGGTGTSAISPDFNNLDGTVQVDSGTLNLGGLYGVNSNGTFNVSAGAVLLLTAYNPIYRGTFTGSGAGKVLLNAFYLQAVGATFSFPGPLLQWVGGELRGSATNVGMMTAAGAASKTLQSCTLYNPGTFAVTDSGALVFHGGVLENLPTGTVDLQSDASMSLAYQQTGSITNWGRFRKSGGTGTSAIAPDFVNLDGTVQVDSGTLSLGGLYGVSSNGTFNVSAGAVLVLAAYNPSYRGTFTGSGAGKVLLNHGVLYLSGATFSFPGPLLQWVGGELRGSATNAGMMTAAGTAPKTLKSCTLYNPGTLAVTDSGALVFDTGVLENLPSGTVDLQSDASMSLAYVTGSITNWGLFRKSGGTGTSAISPVFKNQNGSIEVDSGVLLLGSGSYSQGSGTLTVALGGRGAGQSGRLAVGTTANLAGPLNVTLANGFALATGDRFQILSCATRSGTFSTLNLPAGTTLNYSNNAVFLVVTGALPVLITSPALSGTNFTLSFNTLSACAEINSGLVSGTECNSIRAKRCA